MVGDKEIHFVRGELHGDVGFGKTFDVAIRYDSVAGDLDGVICADQLAKPFQGAIAEKIRSVGKIDLCVVFVLLKKGYRVEVNGEFLVVIVFCAD